MDGLRTSCPSTHGITRSGNAFHIAVKPVEGHLWNPHSMRHLGMTTLNSFPHEGFTSPRDIPQRIMELALGISKIKLPCGVTLGIVEQQIGEEGETGLKVGW